MKIRILDLTRQYKNLKDEIEPAVCALMESGMFIGGPVVENFEREFAQYLGVRHAISVNSGTDALILSLKAFGIGSGDEVITTPFTFFASAEAISAVGATPVFVDIEEDTYNIDADKIEAKITDRTKAILPVHIFGQPANMNKILEIAKSYDFKVIEDACQAAGAEWNGKKVGGIGDIGCFSFFPTKNMGAFGDSGMITTNDDNLAVVCRAFKEHGMAQNGAKARYILDGVKDELEESVSEDGLYNPYKYYNYLIGGNSRMDALQAAVLSIKLKHLEEFNNKRAVIARYYNEKFAACNEIITPIERAGTKCVWHQYAFRCKDKNNMGKFLEGKDIGSAAFYPVPLHLQKAYTALGYGEGDLPIAEMITKQTVCLPIYPELSFEEADKIVAGVNSYYDHGGK